MRRREFMMGAGTAAVSSLVLPLAGQAQQSTPVIGFLNSHFADEVWELVDAFRGGLRDHGFVVGRDVSIEFHWAEGQYDRLPQLAGDLVRRQVAVIIGSDNPSAVAAKKATSRIPIVFTSDGGPIALGLVSSLNRPGGNLTGVGLF